MKERAGRTLAAARWAWPALVQAAGASILLSRTLIHPTTALPGSSGGDAYKHAWAMWHDLAMIGGGTWPSTPYLAAPDGGALFDVMLAPALIMAPITATLGPVAATNAWVWLCLLGVGLSVHGLARRLGSTAAGAVAAGLLAQNAPYLLGVPLDSGVFERLPVWVFPCLLLGLLRIRDRGGWRIPALVILAYSTVTLGCPSYGVFSAVMVLFALPALLWFPGKGDAGSSARIRLVRLLPTFVGLTLVSVLLFGLVHWVAHQPDYVAEDRTDVIRLGVGLWEFQTGANPRDLLSPAGGGVMFPQPVDTETVRVVYLGWVVVVAALAGLVLAARRRDWLGITVVGMGFLFAVLSLGATFRVGEQHYLNPVGWLAGSVLPVYGSGPSMWQQVALFAVLAPVGCAWLVSAVPGSRLRGLAAGALVAAAVAERVAVVPVPAVADAAPAQVAAVYSEVEGEGALVDLPRIYLEDVPPLGPVRRTRDPIFLAQTQHRRPIPFGLNAGTTAWSDFPPVSEGVSGDWPASLACLEAHGIRWVVLHPPWFTDTRSRQVAVRELTRIAGPPIHQDPEAALYDLGEVDLSRMVPEEGCPPL